jgi:uncharacterized protein YyaL (SSP411 family)
MTSGDDRRRANHLEGQTSPYLLQHLYNPVDWYPWGAEALERARREDRPIFLSIGYAACHWCHVMERESFEDGDVAALLNRNFVPIKVDREERPDADEIYMAAVQMLTGSGGWPLNVFLTPDLRPFFGGTYFPPDERYGRPGFATVLRHVQEAWSTRRAEIDGSADSLTEQVRRVTAGNAAPSGDGAVGRGEIARAAAELIRRFDARWGGFGGAPKFPPDGALTLLLREHARTGEVVPLQVVERTLQGMALGGMYDHVGGGFARYSVDERWLVPHFEKMLYNQALLVPVYAEAWRVTARAHYRRVVEETLDFVSRELTDAGGGFHASLDADSEGEEGRFYVWTPDEIRGVLGKDDSDLFCRVYGITAGGNFEGHSIPALLAGSLEDRAAELGLDADDLVSRLRSLRRRLLVARERRVRPATDDKVLTSWNGLMITAFARAHQALGRPGDLDAGQRAADFLLARSTRGDRLLVSYREGEARLNAYLDEYAFVGRGLLDLYEAGFEDRYLDAAAMLARALTEHFVDEERGGFFFTSDDHEALLARSRSQHDGALPSGAGVATELLLRLAVHLDDDRLRRVGLRALEAYRPLVARMPSAFAALLAAADFALDPGPEVAIVGDPGDPTFSALLAVARGRYLPRLVVAAGPEGAGEARPLLAGKPALDSKPTAYVCRDYACRAPTTDPGELERQLRSATERR